jgi:hypothetical protein
MIVEADAVGGSLIEGSAWGGGTYTGKKKGFFN